MGDSQVTGNAEIDSSTGRKIVKQKRENEKMKINNEVTRWAFGYKFDADVVADQDSDYSLNDEYLDELGGVYKTKEELAEVRLKKKKKFREQKVEVKNLMDMLRRRDLTNNETYQSKSKFLSMIEAEAKKEKTADAAAAAAVAVANFNVPSMNIDSIMTFDDMNKEDVLSGDDGNSGYDSSKEKKDKKHFKSNKMSRAQPGIIQQNITVERVFLKDLLKLSRQRYIAKLGMEFQSKRFTEKQQRKGLMDPATLIKQKTVYPHKTRFDNV
jgi:hypothetical protein